MAWLKETCYWKAVQLLLLQFILGPKLGAYNVNLRSYVCTGHLLSLLGKPTWWVRGKPTSVLYPQQRENCESHEQRCPTSTWGVMMLNGAGEMARDAPRKRTARGPDGAG